MNSLPPYAWPFIGMVVNLIWTALNVRTLAGLKEQIRKEFPTRTECTLTQRISDDRHAEVCRRLDCLEGVLPRQAHGRA